MTIAFYTLDGTKNSNPEPENSAADNVFTKADINAIELPVEMRDLEITLLGI